MEENKRQGVCVICIDSDQSRHNHSKWGDYSVKAWDKYCNKHSLGLHIISDIDFGVHHPKWMKIYALESCDFEQVLLVDSDTMPSPNARNIFEDKNQQTFYAVADNINLKWLHTSVSAYQEAFFPNFELNYGNYFNSGVLLFSKEHKFFFEKLQEFYNKNKEVLQAWNLPNTGLDQTIINFFVQQLNLPLELMGHSWNQFGMQSLELLRYNFQTGDPTPYFVKTGNIWHFTGLPVEYREGIMSQLWKTFYEL